MKMYPIYQLSGISLIDCGAQRGSIKDLAERFSSIEGYVVVDPDDLPADFSVDTYTIEGGELVPASAELIVIRQAAALVALREAVRVAREARYESEPIKSLYWSWIESGLEADRALWIAAKNAIRTELPYPETPTAV